MWSGMTHGRLVGRCCQTEPVLLLTAMKADGVWPETISWLWTRTNPKSGPASSTQTGICRRRGMGLENVVRKCTFGNRGETYAATLVYDEATETFEIGSWGDWLERAEAAEDDDEEE